ncbi:M6 family metalloprotease domain-containing protein [Streptomyces europaeiscabiei]|uniref:M6 family metalloprotease domain-containing protein n=1 Tax=Streptomyces europaeiscabiei TaxID=146819 RepID=UPI0038F765C2
MSPRPVGSRTARAVWSDFCAVAPSPELRDRIRSNLDRIRETNPDYADLLAPARPPHPLGFDDGTMFPPSYYPAGTPAATIRGAGAERAPLQGDVRVIVILLDFPDKAMTATTQHFEDLFFSKNTLPYGSVREYYEEVTNGKVTLTGDVVGPLRMPRTLAWYANNNHGIGQPSGEPRAFIMAKDAAVKADPLVDFAPFDNDGNGYVDAFVLVHAGKGGEVTGNRGDLWSHKWNLWPTEYSADGTRIFTYLTIPEDAKIGVSAHELGHLLFGLPDLYDDDYTSEGVGNWCLMGGGSWGGGGDIPTHPSAWCKAQQKWVTTKNVTAAGTLSLPDVKSSFEVHRVWKDGLGGKEYFLLENRQQTGYDKSMPAAGLCLWHVDESQADNKDEHHYMVGLMQADGNRDLEQGANRGDKGDPYPGNTGNTAFTSTSNPSSHSYAGAETGVSITNISASAPVMTADVSLSPTLAPTPSPAEGVPATSMAPGADTRTEAGFELTGEILEIQARLAAMEQDLANIAAKVFTPLMATGTPPDPARNAAYSDGRSTPR